MSKHIISNPVFLEASQAKIGFNLISETNNFTSIFDFKPLDNEEKTRIHKMLLENFQINGMSEDAENIHISADFQEITKVTAEIKSIQKQSLVLIGERINKVRKILKSYKEGTFTQSLKETFNSKQTGYNILAYYEFYTALPSLELKEKFRKLPQKTAYLLASRAANLEDKVNILQDSEMDQTDENLILPFIRERLPLNEKDKRRSKGSNPLLIDTLFKNLQAIYKKRQELTSEMKVRLYDAKKLMDDILSG